MKSFGAYISKHLVSFAAFIFVLLLINILAFGWTFRSAITKDYGDTSPQKMLEATAAASTSAGITDEMAQKLNSNHIWAMFLSENGEIMWSLDLPDEIPEKYTMQDVAVFSKGYLADYPVFVWNMEDGLLVLGYPQDSFTKITTNYLPIRMVRLIPLYVIGMFSVDLLLLFLIYYGSKRKIIRSTEPIIESIKTLSDGKPVSLCVHGELSEIADSVNRASQILSKQNTARANWISGVSHDIRTPLSMIMGYAERIAQDETASQSVVEQAEIVRKQSIKIKELVQDLNLVSQLEYEMQPLHKEQVRLSKLIRSYIAELLNTGVYDAYTLNIEIAPDAETAVLECDARLISRAINNLVQNSIKHNPQGCEIRLALKKEETSLMITVADNGVGMSPEKIQELEEKPHYMESMDEGLDLRHGLGLLIVREIVTAHRGILTLESVLPHGCKVTLIIPNNQII